MKAKREENTFRPVHLTLETQDEVDAVYAVFNHSQIVEKLHCLGSAFETLEPFKSPKAEALHDAVHEHLKKWFGPKK